MALAMFAMFRSSLYVGITMVQVPVMGTVSWMSERFLTRYKRALPLAQSTRLAVELHHDKLHYDTLVCFIQMFHSHYGGEHGCWLPLP